ncbi:hypothetical protein GS416_11695 [Rhodococcus hoagii]|nr:hypothetical protein [Prescottella equi]
MTNGAPHYIGRDIEKGDPVAYELPDGTVEVDSLEEIEYEESPERIGYRLQIGFGDASVSRALSLSASSASSPPSCPCGTRG